MSVSGQCGRVDQAGKLTDDYVGEVSEMLSKLWGYKIRTRFKSPDCT